ncbi:uncharacterized protein [Ptychodera flava]|uniref:uncharacterized protein n=1 Tax=Ptychodera flava TaxID=63121 RepID=UPI00396A8B50
MGSAKLLVFITVISFYVISTTAMPREERSALTVEDLSAAVATMREEVDILREIAGDLTENLVSLDTALEVVGLVSSTLDDVEGDDMEEKSKRDIFWKTGRR